MSLDFFAFLSVTLGVGCAALLIWNLSLIVQNTRLRVELLQRERWHERELAKWREKI